MIPPRLSLVIAHSANESSENRLNHQSYTAEYDQQEQTDAEQRGQQLTKKTCAYGAEKNA